MPEITPKHPTPRYDDTIIAFDARYQNRGNVPALLELWNCRQSWRTTYARIRMILAQQKGKMEMPTPTGKVKATRGRGTLTVTPNNGDTFDDVFELLEAHRGTTISYPISEDWAGVDSRGQDVVPSASQVFKAVQRESILRGPTFMVSENAVYRLDGRGVKVRETYKNRKGQEKTRDARVPGVVEIVMDVEGSQRSKSYSELLTKIRPQWWLAELEVLAARQAAEDEESE